MGVFVGAALSSRENSYQIERAYRNAHAAEKAAEKRVNAIAFDIARTSRNHELGDEFIDACIEWAYAMDATAAARVPYMSQIDFNVGIQP